MYDDGMNRLICSKCGCRYKAIELKKKIKDNEIIVRSKGEKKMKVKIKGGSVNANKVVSTESVNNDNFKDTVENILSRANTPEVESNMKIKVNLKDKTYRVERTEEPAVKEVKKVTPVVEEVKEEVKSVNGVTVETDEEYHPSEELQEFLKELDEEPVKAVEEEIVVEDDDVEVVEPEKKEVFTPFTIDESKINTNAIENTPKKNPVEIIDDAVDTIVKNLQEISIDVVKEDAINRMVSRIISAVPNTGKAFNTIMSICEAIFDNTEEDEYIDIVHSEKFLELIGRIFDPTISLDTVNKDGNNLNIDYNVVMNYGYDNNDVAFVTDAKSLIIEDVFDEKEVKDETPAESTEEDTEEYDPSKYNGIAFANGVVIETTSIFPDAEKDEIIVGVDEDGNYITNSEGMIIGYNFINDCEVSTVDIVSKEWVASVSKIINEDDEVIPADTLGVATVDQLEE